MSDGYIEGIHADVIYDDSFGHCCGVLEHENFFVDIYKSTYLVCEDCKVKKIIGYGVFGDWWEETEEMWQKRWEHIRDYDFCR
jgi:hypothetical protein